MKKKVLLLTVITVVVLLAGTVIGFAVDAANKNAEAESAAEKELEIQKVLSELQISPDSQAGQVLIEVLSKKEISEYQLSVYSEMSDEIQKMDYEAVSAKLKEYADVEQTLAEKSWNEAMADEAFRERVAQMLVYKEYARILEVDEPLYQSNRQELYDFYYHGVRISEEKLESLEKNLSNQSTVQVAKIFIETQKKKVSEFAGEMLEIFEQRKADGYDIDKLNEDMYNFYEFAKAERAYYTNLNINDDSITSKARDCSYIKSRYLAGESIEQIING